MPCNECPETPDTGCLQPITTECVTYNGNDVNCADIASGQSLNQVIEQLANNDCDLQEQVEDIVQDIEELSGNVINLQIDLEELSGSIQTQIDNIPTFSCEDLSGCSIDDLSDVDINPKPGDVLSFDGVKWIAYSPEVYAFTCEELSGCTLDELSGVVLTNSVSGDVIINNGEYFTNFPISSLLADLQNQVNILNSQLDIQNSAITLLSIRMDECACPSGAALDVDFSDARLNLCTQNTTLGKFVTTFTLTGSGTDLNVIEGATLITVSIPDSINPLLYVTPTTVPDVSPVSKTFDLLSGMKSEIASGGGGGTITYTVRFTDNSALVHFAEITFTIPEFDTTGDNCDNDLAPSSIVFDNLL